jgi:hypothetical protein
VCTTRRSPTASKAWGDADERIGVPLMHAGQEVPAQLEKLGLSPGDVRYVVCKHLHGDHVGGHLYFPDATFVCQQAEIDYAREPDMPSMVREYPLDQIAPDRLTYETIEGDHDLSGDGTVQLSSTPGHTPGHQSLLLRLPETGPVLLSGDACWTQWNLDEMTLPGIIWFPSAYVASRRRLRVSIRTSRAPGLEFGLEAMVLEQVVEVRHAEVEGDARADQLDCLLLAAGDGTDDEASELDLAPLPPCRREPGARAPGSAPCATSRASGQR